MATNITPVPPVPAQKPSKIGYFFLSCARPAKTGSPIFAIRNFFGECTWKDGEMPFTKKPTNHLIGLDLGIVAGILATMVQTGNADMARPAVVPYRLLIALPAIRC